MITLQMVTDITEELASPVAERQSLCVPTGLVEGPVFPLSEELPVRYNPTYAQNRVSHWNPFSAENVETRQKIHANKQIHDVWLSNKLQHLKLAHREMRTQKKRWKESAKLGHERYKLQVRREAEAQRLGFDADKILKSQATFGKERGRGRPRKEPLSASILSQTDHLLGQYTSHPHDFIDVPYRDISSQGSSRTGQQKIAPVRREDPDSFDLIKSVHDQSKSEVGIRRSIRGLLGPGH